MVASALWPIGHIEQQVIAFYIAAPNREPQIVADERADFPTLPCCHQLTLTGGVGLMLGCEREQMSLVVAFVATIWAHPHQPVEVVATFLGDEAARYNSIHLASLFGKPTHRLARHGFCQLFGIHAKACGEHLWQHYHVRLSRQWGELGRKLCQICLDVFPFEGGLDRGDAQLFSHFTVFGNYLAGVVFLRNFQFFFNKTPSAH